jgi:hypothetical protein
MGESGSEYSVRLALARARVAIAHANVLSLELGVSITRSDVFAANAEAQRLEPPERHDPSTSPRQSRETAYQSETGPSNGTNYPDRASCSSSAFCSDSRFRAASKLQQGTEGESKQEQHLVPLAASPPNATLLHHSVKRMPVAEIGKDKGPVLKQQVQGIASRLASLKDQQDTTLKQLLALRLQQLMLRKQQLSALHGLLVAQVQVLGDAPVVATAVWPILLCITPGLMI